MKRTDKQLAKTLDNDLQRLSSVLPLLSLNDKRRLYVLNQIQLIKKILKIDEPTQVNVTTTKNESPLANYIKKHKNETITQKAKQRSKYNV